VTFVHYGVPYSLTACGFNSPTKDVTTVTAEGSRVEQGVTTHTEICAGLTFSRTMVAMNSSEFEPEGTGSNLQLVMSKTLK
jgi:hypothetical protein